MRMEPNKATPPMHSWLPDAHGRAPSEISAMFSAVLLPIAVYAIYSIFNMEGLLKPIDSTLPLPILTIMDAVQKARGIV